MKNHLRKGVASIFFESEGVLMLYDFLIENEKEILAMTAKKSLSQVGIRSSSEQLKVGLPIFYKQLIAALRSDSSLMALNSGSENRAISQSAGVHGGELMKMGYTLSQVVHSYGSLCQSITELANDKKLEITPGEFRHFNHFQDVAIAGAVTEFQLLRDTQVSDREIQHLGFLAHELRNALATVSMSLELIKEGTVGFGGSVGQVLDRGLKRMEDLIDHSLTEVRLRVDPKVHVDKVDLLKLVDQIVITAEIDARVRLQTLEIRIDPGLFLFADQQLLYSAISNLIQNAIKYTHDGGKIQIRGRKDQGKIVIEVEDECGGLANDGIDLFKPFEQQNENRKGLGLGLTIAQRAVLLNGGTIEVQNLPGQGCIFRITLPQKI